MPSAIYARYSSHNQDGGTSIEVQLEVCRGVAESGAKEYIDKAVTGTTMSRPAFDRMLRDAEAGLFDTLYIHKYDRFGRSAYAHAIAADLEAMGVRVVSATEGDDALSRGIQLVVAEDYSRKLSERCKAGQRKRFTEGLWVNGTPPFGYAVEDSRLVIHAGESSAVRVAFEDYATGGHSYRDIARKIEGMGFSPRRTPRWSAGSMSRLLKTQLYKGIRSYQELRLPAPELRIVSDETWQRVQDINTHRRGHRKGNAGIRPFTRLLFCGECGFRMVRRVDTHNGKKYPARLVCGRRHGFGVDACCNDAIVMEGALLRGIRHDLAEVVQDVAGIAAMAVDAAREQAGHMQQATDRLQREARRHDAEIARMLDLLTTGAVPDPEAIAAISARLAERQARRDELHAEIEAAGTDAGFTAAEIEAEVARVVDDIRQRVTIAATHAQTNALLADSVGPMEAGRDGRVRPSSVSTSPAQTEHSYAVVRAAFWSLRLAA